MRWLLCSATALLTLSTAVAEYGCSMKDVMTCVVQLKSYNVPIDTNMMNIVFNITTEAKLVHVCRAYNNVMPCFQQKLATCANEKQKMRLAEVNRLLLFICAPFSLQRQRTLLRVGPCIGKVLGRPVQPSCATKDHRYDEKLQLCRENCGGNDVVCQMRVRMSELAVCSVIAIEAECGRQAADFYSYMQTAIIGEEFPIQCKYDFAADKIRKLLDVHELPELTELAKREGSVPSASLSASGQSHFVVQELVLPTPEKSLRTATAKTGIPTSLALSRGPTKKEEREEATALSEDVSLLFAKNFKFNSNPALAKKTLQRLQLERRKSTAGTVDTGSRPELDSASQEETESSKTQIVRSRNFARIFRPSKFSEPDLKKSYQQTENMVVVQLVPSTPEDVIEPSTSTLPPPAVIEEVRKDSGEIPGFLFGARPIPDSSATSAVFLSRGQVESPEKTHTPEIEEVVKKPLEPLSNAFASFPRPPLTAVRETYAVKPELSSSTTTSAPTRFSASSTTTAVTTAITTTIKTTSQTTTSSPPTTTAESPVSLIFLTLPTVAPTTTKENNERLLPWYYNTFTTAENVETLPTSAPGFPHFNASPVRLEQSPSTVSIPLSGNYQSFPNVFDPDKFAVNFVASIGTSPTPPLVNPLPPPPPVLASASVAERQLPFNVSSSAPKISDELSSLLNFSNFREKADSILTTAIDVLKPREKFQHPFADASMTAQLPPQLRTIGVPSLAENAPLNHDSNKSASAALSELMDTLERISPSVLENIREKLDRLGHGS